MLVLARKEGEEVLISPAAELKISVVRLDGETVRLGFEAPKEVAVLRAGIPSIRPTESLLKRVAEERHLKHSARNAINAVMTGLQLLEAQIRKSAPKED